MVAKKFRFVTRLLTCNLHVLFPPELHVQMILRRMLDRFKVTQMLRNFPRFHASPKFAYGMYDVSVVYGTHGDPPFNEAPYKQFRGKRQYFFIACPRSFVAWFSALLRFPLLVISLETVTIT